MNCRYTDICNFALQLVCPEVFLELATTRGLTTAFTDSASLVILRIDYRIFVHGKNYHLIVEVAPVGQGVVTGY